MEGIGSRRRYLSLTKLQGATGGKRGRRKKGMAGTGEAAPNWGEMCRLRTIRISSISYFCKRPAPKCKTRCAQTCCIWGLKAKIRDTRDSNGATYVTFHPSWVSPPLFLPFPSCDLVPEMLKSRCAEYKIKKLVYCR